MTPDRIDRMDNSQMTALEETTGGETAEETMVLREPSHMATGTHEISAKRFHAWGNL